MTVPIYHIMGCAQAKRQDIVDSWMNQTGARCFISWDARAFGDVTETFDYLFWEEVADGSTVGEAFRSAEGQMRILGVLGAYPRMHGDGDIYLSGC